MENNVYFIFYRAEAHAALLARGDADAERVGRRRRAEVALVVLGGGRSRCG